MTDDKPSLKDLLVESRSEEERGLRYHPTSEELVRFRRGNLPQDEEESALEHIGVCRECADRLASCSRQAPENAASSHTKTDSVRPSLEGELTVWDNVRDWLWPKDQPMPVLASGLAVLAVLSLVALAASQWQRAQAATSRWQEAQQAVAALSKPQVNIEIFQVKRASRGDGGVISTFEVGADDNRFVIVLPIDGEYEEYEVRILGPGDRELWSSRELRPDPYGVQTRFELSRHLLAGGDYVFEVSGVEGGKRQAPHAHRVTLIYN